MRLTKKEELPKVPCYVEIQEEHWKTKHRQQAIDKLGRLEDLEEELGIDLITLFQAILLKGIYVRCGKMYEHIPPKDLWLRTDASPYIIDFLKSDCRHCLADYGKTWALAREELL